MHIIPLFKAKQYKFEDTPVCLSETHQYVSLLISNKTA